MEARMQLSEMPARSSSLFVRPTEPGARVTMAH
jgi:hypothetical protein